MPVLVADCYFPGSVKDAEKHGHGESDSRKILIKSILSQVPKSDFASFLSNGENKTRMIQLISEFTVKHKAKILNLLRTTVLILSREDECQKVTFSTCEAFQEQLSNQEEAETKVIIHAVHALQQQAITRAVIKSGSGDTDIIILSISLLSAYKENVFMKNGSGTNHVLSWLGNFDLSPQE